jgi:hypothetical protein
VAQELMRRVEATAPSEPVEPEPEVAT